jgi:hypothetical protein
MKSQPSTEPVIITSGLPVTFTGVSDDTAKMFAYSIVGTSIDDWNSLLYGMPNKNIKLHILQNSLAHKVLQVPKFTRATLLLQSLHWQPEALRIMFNMAVITYKAKMTSTPAMCSISSVC